jgi:hypothetical protein
MDAEVAGIMAGRIACTSAAGACPTFACRRVMGCWDSSDTSASLDHARTRLCRRAQDPLFIIVA